jgi:hypothetical protein
MFCYQAKTQTVQWQCFKNVNGTEDLREILLQNRKNHNKNTEAIFAMEVKLTPTPEEHDGVDKL